MTIITLEAATVGFISILLIIVASLLREKFKDIEVAKNKAISIEKNYLVRFDELHLAIKNMESRIVKLLTDNKLEYYKSFALRKDCEKIHDRLDIKLENE